MPDVAFRIGIEGGVDLAGMPRKDLIEHMKRSTELAIQKGMITGDSPVTLDEYDVRAMVMEMRPVSDFKLVISGYLCLNGHSKERLEEHIDKEVIRFADLGLIAGDTLAEMTDFEVSVTVTRTSGWLVRKHQPEMGI